MVTDHAAMRAAAEARKTVAARLRAMTIDYDKSEMPGEARPIGVACADLREAADAIDYLHGQIAQLRQDMREEQREAQREVRDAVAEARWQASQGEDHGSY